MDFKQLCIEIVGEDFVRDDSDSLSYYGRDTAKDFQSSASLIVLPQNTEQVQKVIQVANKHKIAIVPSGGRTGLCGGAAATQGECVLSLERMNKITEVSESDQVVRCEAGVKTQTLKDTLAEHGLTFPVSIASQGSSHIGGNIATNAGGMHVIRYGATRNWVLGLTVVTGAGEIIQTGGRLYKNQTGYDLKNLFTGSEGTLCIITEVILALTPKPAELNRSICATSSYDALLPVLSAAKKKFGGSLSAVEFFERSALERVTKHHKLRDPFAEPHNVYILFELERDDPQLQEDLEEFFMPLIEADHVQDVVISNSSAQSEEIMNLREYISETMTAHYSPHKNDIAVPVSTLPEFIVQLKDLMQERYPEVLPVLFGHIGDGNIHVNLLKPEKSSLEDFCSLCHNVIDKEIYELVMKFQGSISAEHGIGLLKRDYLPYSKSKEEIAAMQAIKKVFDPNGILNPGKIFEAA